jgi:phage FluMu protein Com
MPITVQCTGCGHRLRVADTMAGKQGKCPKCKAILSVPSPIDPSLASQPVNPVPSPTVPARVPVREAAPATAKVTTLALQSVPEIEDVVSSDEFKPVTGPSALDDVWYVRTPAGEQHGPLVRSTVDEWLADGRIGSLCTVLWPGSDHWALAPKVFPQLNPIEPLPLPHHGGERLAHFAAILAKSRPWAIVLAILVSIAGLGYLSMAGYGGQQLLKTVEQGKPLNEYFWGGVAGCVFMVFVVIATADLARWMFVYAGSVTQFRRMPSMDYLENVLTAQMRVWRLVGLLSFLVLTLLASITFVGLVVPLIRTL